jgi:hypothetical protein
MPRTRKIRKAAGNGKLSVQEPETVNIEVLSEETSTPSTLSEQEKQDLYHFRF